MVAVERHELSVTGSAAALAGFVLSTLEGAIVLARAAKDPARLLQSAPFVRKAVEPDAETWLEQTAN